MWEGRVADDEGIPWFGRAGTPWPGGVNDGIWHRTTIEIKGSGEPQYVRWWFDGVLVWDDSPSGHHYPRPNEFRFFGNYSYEVGDEGSIYFDDLILWKR